MKKWIFLATLFANVLQAEYLALESAYQQVLAQNDGLKSSQSAQQKQAKLRNATKMLYLPQISVGAAYIRLQEPMHLQMFDASALGAIQPPLDALLHSLAKPIALEDQNIIFG
ncbi:MAG: TolC family protein, partial [Helicobacter sp.]|nr:TolC family protein [Helicobacter sp.]